MISPRTTVHWPEHLRIFWLRARLERCARRGHNGRWDDHIDLGDPVA